MFMNNLSNVVCTTLSQCFPFVFPRRRRTDRFLYIIIIHLDMNVISFWKLNRPYRANNNDRHNTQTQIISLRYEIMDFFLYYNVD